MVEVRTQPVTAKRFDDIDDVRGVPGAFEYYKAGDQFPAGLIYSCPCGCGKQRSLQFRPAYDTDRASWEFDGNLDKPTLTPSIHWVGHWHGWLRDGVWISC